ncbi:MAG: hypothetical protein V4654_04800 [Bdellovibrionota bacterium]
MLKIQILLVTIFFSPSLRASTSDYSKLAYIDQTIFFGLGVSYSKLETYTNIGNYFVVSQTNPRLDFRYVSKVEEDFRYYWHMYYVREKFAAENPNLSIINNQDLNRYGLAYKPHWFTEGKGFSYGLNFKIKQANFYSAVPTPSLLYGEIKQRLSYQVGGSFKWYGQTLTKLPVSLDLDFSYVNHFTQNADFDYGEGFNYSMALDFDFGRRSYFTNYNLRFFYENEKIQTDLRPFVEKELGFTVAKAISF